MPAPMPPVAPVTRAFLPGRSNMFRYSLRRIRRLGCQQRQRRVDIGGNTDARRVQLLDDALGEAGKHLAGTDLEHIGDAVGAHVTDAFAPAHRAGDLLYEAAF